MSFPQPVWIHESQHAAAIAQARRDSLVHGRMHPQFHYATPRQSQLWTKVFQQHSLVNHTEDFGNIYRYLFTDLAAHWKGKSVHLVGLGTGTGLKDQWLAQALKLRHPTLSLLFTPVDVSPTLALGSAQRLAPLQASAPRPLVCDLPLFPGLPQWLKSYDREVPRIYTFFGMTPNFRPATVFPLLRSFLRPQDRLVLSANLAPGGDESPSAYETGCEQILAQYDNPACATWLSAVLQDWGLTPWLKKVTVTTAPIGNLRGVVAQAHWKKTVSLSWEGRRITLSPRRPLGLFFSLRYTPQRLATTLTHYRLKLGSGYMTWNDEEGVWSVTR